MVNELNAHPAVQNSVWIATTIPWSFKVSQFLDRAVASYSNSRWVEMYSPPFGGPDTLWLHLGYLPDRRREKVSHSSSHTTEQRYVAQTHALSPCRRPFIFLGYLICAVSYLCLAALYTPSAPSLALLVGLATFGMVMADTTCDSLVVERLVIPHHVPPDP